MVFVSVNMAAVAMVGAKELQAIEAAVLGPMVKLTSHTWHIAAGLVLFSLATAAWALWIGARNFERLEH